MAVGQTNISIALVQQAIGVYSSNSLGALIAKAKVGGVGGYAFYIYETRASNGNRYDGVLIAGAEPHWNIWSRYIPAEWAPVSGVLILRLKRNALNPNGGYDFRLHDFRGYDHTALRPEISAPSTFYKPFGNATISFQIRLHQVLIDHTHVLVAVTIGTQTKTVLLPKTAIEEGANITHYDVEFTNVSTQSGGTIRAYSSTDAGTELVDLQNLFGIFSFELVQNPYIEVTTIVGSNNSITVEARMYKGYGAEKVAWNNNFGANIVITGSIKWYQTVNASGNPTGSPVNVLPSCTPEPFTVTIAQGYNTGLRMITIGDPSEVIGTNLYACMLATGVTPTPTDTTFTVSPYIASQYTY